MRSSLSVEDCRAPLSGSDFVDSELLLRQSADLTPWPETSPMTRWVATSIGCIRKTCRRQRPKRRSAPSDVLLIVVAHALKIRRALLEIVTSPIANERFPRIDRFSGGYSEWPGLGHIAPERVGSSRLLPKRSFGFVALARYQQHARHGESRPIQQFFPLVGTRP